MVCDMVDCQRTRVADRAGAAWVSVVAEPRHIVHHAFQDGSHRSLRQSLHMHGLILKGGWGSSLKEAEQSRYLTQLIIQGLS